MVSGTPPMVSGNAVGNPAAMSRRACSNRLLPSAAPTAVARRIADKALCRNGRHLGGLHLKQYSMRGSDVTDVSRDQSDSTAHVAPRAV